MQRTATRVPRTVIVVLDQGAYAAANLSLGLLLGYVEGLAALGRYALIYSVAAVAHSVFAGWVLDPMTTFASGRASPRSRVYFGRLGSLVGAIGLLFGAAALAMNFFVDNLLLRGAALGISLFSAQSMLLIQKRYLYVSGRVEDAAALSVAYAGLALTLSAIGIGLDTMSESTVVLALALSALITSFRFICRFALAERSVQVRSIPRTELSKYTAWSVATSLPAAAAMQSIYWVAGSTSTVAVVGQLKLYEQVMMPVMQILGAAVLADHVSYSASVQDGNPARVFKRVSYRQFQYAAFVALYGLIALAAVYFMQQNRSPDTGSSLSPLLLYACGIACFSAGMANSVVLRALRAPQFIALAYTVAAATVLLSPLWMQSRTIVDFSSAVLFGWVVYLGVLARAVAVLRRRLDRTPRSNTVDQ